MTRRTSCALIVFFVAVTVRILFWQATPDRSWGWSAFFKGDAPLWLEYGRALDTGETFELGLPIRPPGAAWLVALLWDGSQSGLALLRLWWIAIGALVPLLVFFAAERHFGLTVAMWAATFCAVSNGLLILSTTIDNETPYLVAAMLSLLLTPDATSSRARAAGWGATHAIACLFRAEHLIFFALALVYSAISERPRRVGRVALAFGVFAVVLVPWHLSAWSAIRRFNEEPRRLSPMEANAIGSVESALGSMWTAEGRRRCEELPAFTRPTLCAFVLATVHHRGGERVGAEDFRILEEAFAYFPRPLARFPFVAASGPLNFYLGNHPRATGGFDRSPLEEPPPLRGSYPEYLVQNLPPPRLTFFYPPHLRLFNEGDRLAWEWIARQPGDFARLVSRKLAIFWAGAAAGLTGYNVPMGASGVRRAVDLVVAERAPLWRALIFIAAAAGLATAWRRRELWPWLLYLGSRVAATILFFGYARIGATAIPVIALLVALLIDRFASRAGVKVAIAVLVASLVVESARVASRPTMTIDGEVIGTNDRHADDRTVRVETH